VLHGVRELSRESVRSLQFSKEWKDVMTVFAPCKLVDLYQYSCAFGLNLICCVVMFFIFVIFRVF
jgi:hypothetical protein